MRFEEALKAMRKGKNVTRNSWSLILGKKQIVFMDYRNDIYFGTSIDNYEMINIPVKWILAEDWEVIDD